MSHKDIGLVFRLDVTVDQLIKLPSRQFNHCISHCTRDKCPPEAIMAAKMDPKGLECDLWREDESQKR